MVLLSFFTAKQVTNSRLANDAGSIPVHSGFSQADSFQTSGVNATTIVTTSVIRLVILDQKIMTYSEAGGGGGGGGGGGLGKF